MTIEVSGKTIYVRCSSGDPDVLAIETDGTNVRVSLHPYPNGFIGSALDQEDLDDSIPILIIDRTEALALGHMLIDMACRIETGGE